jgi:hypothetical protein
MHQHANFIIEIQLIVKLKEGTTNDGLLPECSSVPHSQLVKESTTNDWLLPECSGVPHSQLVEWQEGRGVRKSKLVV